MKWIKQGLIFEPQPNLDWMRTHAAVPLADWIGEDRYRIYFSGRDQLNRSQTGFIEIDLNNPHRIVALSDEPVLKVGGLGTFDESGAMASWMVRWGDKKYLYYIGWNLGVTVAFRNSIGVAISHDGGRTFVKYSDGPILDRTVHDPFFVASSCVLVEDGRWRMWYLSCVGWEMEGGRPRHRYHIKHAESDNGLEWKRTGVVCIDFKSGDEYAISRPCVMKENDIYKMWYSYRGRSYRIGYAESRDGLKWERKDEEAGIAVSDSGWDSEMIEYPFVFDHKGERYMLYNGNGYGQTGFGLAVLAQSEATGDLHSV
jgi:hypothetical protein